MTVKDPRPRPRSVSAALLLLAVLWVAGTALLVWHLFISPLMVNGWEVSWQAALIIFVPVVALSGGLLAALVFRRRWAYVVWIAMFVISLPSSYSGLSQGLDEGPLTVARWLVVWGANVVPVVLLLRRPGREWYGFVRKA
jgi:hypothetical protein